MVNRYIIDDQGEMWPANDGARWRDLSTTTGLKQLREFSIRNLGFIELRIDRASPQILFRPQFLSPAAFARLMYWMEDYSPKRALLSIFDGEWRHRFFNSNTELRQQLITYSFVARDWAERRFLARREPLEAINASSDIGRVYDKWRLPNAKSPEHVTQWFDDLPCQRYTLTRIKASRATEIVAMGGGYSTYSRQYVRRACGTHLRDEPDPDYGVWLDDAYQQASSTEAGQFHSIDALLRGEHYEVVRMRYLRLLLPFSSPDRGRYILSVSDLSATLDLRC